MSDKQPTKQQDIDADAAIDAAPSIEAEQTTDKKEVKYSVSGGLLDRLGGFKVQVQQC